MRIVAVSTLRAFWEMPGHRGSEQALKTWVAVTKAARWQVPPDIKRTFNSADILRDSRVVFDIGGNKVRMVAKVNFRRSIVYVRFIGTHAEYDKVDAQAI